MNVSPGVKKRPGRPRKTPIKEASPRKGIAAEPLNESNYIEMIYDRPMVLKKTWMHFKNLAVERLQLIFRRDSFIMYGEDHHKKSQIRACIDTKGINHYYGSDVLDIGIMCSDLEKVMATVDKSCPSIAFYSKRGHTQKTLKIVLETELQIEKTHQIELVGEYPRLTNEHRFLDTSYLIQFELPGRYFKKMIADIKGFSDQVTVRQDSIEHPLAFEYITRDKKIKSEDIVRNPNSIKFVSQIAPNDIFRASFHVDHVKPISSAILVETVQIAVHDAKPLRFSIEIDEPIAKMCILTDIIDDR